MEAIRLKVKFKIGKYYFCKDWNNKFYKVKINKYIGKKRSGDDFYIYLKKGSRFIFQSYIPISDKEAGVKERY